MTARAFKLLSLPIVATPIVAAIAGCVYNGDFPSQEELYDVPPSPDAFVVHTNDHATSATVAGRDVFGPDVRMSLYSEPADRALRGTVGHYSVSIDVGASSADGAVGVAPFQLSVHREDGVLHATGKLLWQPSELTLSHDRLTTVIGSCHYELHRVDDLSFEGRRGCSGPGEAVTVRIPPALDRWGDVASATALVLLLNEA